MACLISTIYRRVSLCRVAQEKLMFQMASMANWSIKWSHPDQLKQQMVVARGAVLFVAGIL